MCKEQFGNGRKKSTRTMKNKALRLYLFEAKRVYSLRAVLIFHARVRFFLPVLRVTNT